MAITQTRIKLGDTWTNLTLNQSTGKWEGSIVSYDVSPEGGYFALTADTSNSTGNTTTVNGEQVPALRLEVVDTTAPVLVVNTPEDGFITAQGSVIVSGFAQDSSGIGWVKINGVSVPLEADGTYIQSVSLTEGENVITVQAADTVGNLSEEVRTGLMDSVAPNISLTSPAVGQMVSASAFTVTGTVSDGGSGLMSVTVNGSAASVMDGLFSLEITLSEGANAITATATDNAGNTASAAGSVLLDTILPTLTVNTPAGDTITNQPFLTVSGIAFDSGSGLDTVTVNGQTVTNGAFSTELALTEGINIITVSATDRVGHATTVSRSVLLDTAPPVLALVSPPEGFINSSTPTVVFSVADEPGGSGIDLDSISAYVDNVPHAATVSDGAITVTTTLNDGPHVVTVTVEDVAGNLRGLSASYTVDTVPPELEVNTLYMRRIVDSKTIEVSGEAWDITAPQVTITVGGNAVPVVNKKFKTNAVLSVGENTIPVVATDGAGNTTTKSVYAIRMLTDRSKADVSVLQKLYEKSMEQWTDAELEWFNHGVVRGAYNASDRNRVGIAVEYLAERLKSSGKVISVSPKKDWTEADDPTRTQMGTYLQNVQSIKSKLPIKIELPTEMRRPNAEDCNHIEDVLVDADRLDILRQQSVIYSGEGFAGEF